MSPEAASGVTAVVVALISGLFVWHTQKDGNKVSKINAVMDAYDSIVKNLQAEVDRMKHDMDDMRSAMEECERRNQALGAEIASLKQQVESLGGKPASESVAAKKPARKAPAAKKTPATRTARKTKGA
jgi:peptidoglycan hydrolase CwlO-like protein